MKRKSIYAILACCLLVPFAACTDAWDEHYQPDPVLNGSESLWELIASDPELKDFATLLHETGYDTLLAMNRNYTVWAPADLSELIDMAALSTASPEQINAYRKEIVENHIADYSHVAGGIRDKEDKVKYKRVKVLNGKSYHFEGSVVNPYSFASNRLKASNIVAKNGVLHKLDKGVHFAANIWEQMAKEPAISKFYNFLNKETVTYFDEANSIIGPIVDGKQTYLDSVFDSRNRWLKYYAGSNGAPIGELNNEDSTYSVYALTDNAWDEMFEMMKELYQYPDVKAKEDFGKDMYLRNISDSIIRERLCDYLVFSNTVNRLFYQGERDTLISTKREWIINDDAHRLGDGAREVSTSNGTLYIVPQVNYDPITCWQDTIRIEAESLTTPGSDREGVYRYEYIYTPSYIDVDSEHPLYGQISGKRIAVFEPNSTKKSEQPILRFLVNNVMSGYYDISIVVVPAHLANPKLLEDEKYNSELFNRFKADIYYALEDGEATSKNLKPAKGAYHETSLTKVDTIVLAKEWKIEYCEVDYKYWTGKDPKTYIEISTPSTNNAKKHTSTYYVDQVLLTPVKPSEE